MTDAPKRRPWYAVALVAGFGGVLAAGLLAMKQGVPQAEAHVATSSITLPPGSISLDERLRNIENAVKALGDEMGEMKRRLPPKP